MAKATSLKEQIDFLLRRRFGTLAPAPAPTLNRLDAAMEEAHIKRNYAIAGTTDPRPAIEKARAAYEAMPISEVQRLVEDARAEDAKAAAAVKDKIESDRLAAWPYWAKQDLWSHAELSQICCGFVPGQPNRSDWEQIAINRAAETIARGTHSGTFQFLARSDEDMASRMYGSHRHYVPVIAAKWAAERFDSFPDALLKATQERLSEQAPQDDDGTPARDFDPNATDYPEHLHIAYLAWCAVSSDATANGQPKARLKAWLEVNYPALTKEATDRIATVCNWNRTGGRGNPSTP